MRAYPTYELAEAPDEGGPVCVDLLADYSKLNQDHNDPENEDGDRDEH